MSSTVRRNVFLVFGAGLAVLLLWSFGGLPDFGHYAGPYGDILNASSIPERQTTAVVSAINFDYRGFDTLGEEFILFAAVMGVTLLLRSQRGEDEEEGSLRERGDLREAGDTSDAVRIASLGLIGPAVLLGLYVIAHGHLTPGGGFQGGVVLTAAPLLLFVAGRYLLLRTVHPMHALDLVEGAGAGGFVVLGLAGLAAASAYLANFIGLGQVGSVFSGGTLPVLNLLVGLEVMAGVTLVLYEFLEQTLVMRER